jgi:pimeloyl-ACP methyl ester carboxylesterase
MSTPGAGAAPERTVPGLTPSLRRRARWLFRMLTAISPGLAAGVAGYLFVRPRARAVTGSERRFLASARAGRVRIPSGSVQVYEWPAAGPTVLLLHGWISHAARMQPLIEALHREGLRIVACDAPAHGRSSGREADLQRFRSAMDAVAAAYGPISAVVAHSFGAMAALGWLAEAADAASVRAAALIGVPRDIGYLFDSFSIAMGLDAEVARRLRVLFQRRYGRDPEQYSALLLAPGVLVPVLLVHGGADELVPLEHARELVQRLPDGQLHVADGLRHSAPLRDAASVTLIARFLVDQLLRSSGARTAQGR